MNSTGYIPKKFLPDVRSTKNKNQSFQAPPQEEFSFKPVKTAVKSEQGIATKKSIDYANNSKTVPSNLNTTATSSLNNESRSTTANKMSQYRLIRQHCKRIRDMLDSPNLEGLDLDSKHQQKIIRKTEITSNNIFSDKELANLITREDDNMSFYGYKMPAADSLALGEPKLDTSAKQQIQGYLKWTEGVSLPRAKDKNKCYKKFQPRNIDKEKIKLEPLISSQTVQAEKPTQTEKRRQNQNAVYSKIQKSLVEYAEKVQKKLLNKSKSSFNFKSKEELIRIQGLYETEVLKYSIKVFEKLGRGCPLAVRFY